MVYQQNNLYICIRQVSFPWFQWKCTSNWMPRFWKKMLQYYPYSIHSNDWFLIEETSKKLKDFILKFSISGSFISRIFKLVHCNTCFFFLQVNVLMRWSAIEQIIMDTQMMCISFSIIHRQPCIWWIMKAFLKLLELFWIYTFV